MTKYKCDVCGEKYDRTFIIIECANCYVRGWKAQFKKDKKIKTGRAYIGKVSLLLMMCIFLFPVASALTEDQYLFCDGYNVSTFQGCITFWNNVTTILNISNVTVIEYVNVTINDTNCSNCSNCSISPLDELTKMDEYSKRGFECVFENGICVNFQKITNVSIDCSSQVSDAVVLARQEERLSCVASSSSQSGSDDTIFIYILIFLVIAFLGYLYFKKKSPVSSHPPELPPDYFIPPTVLKLDQKKEGLKDEKSENLF